MATETPPTLPKPAAIPSFAAMVALPAAIAGGLNLALLISGGSTPIASVFGAGFMTLVMGWWMNRRRNRKLADKAHTESTIANFGAPPAPSGGWANPNRKQRIERWFDRNRVYRRR